MSASPCFFASGQHSVVDQAAGSARQLRPLTGRGLNRIVGLTELSGNVLRRDGRHVGVFPRVVAHLHACVGDALGACRIGRDLVADQEECRLRIVVAEDLQQPVGVRAWPVVECQRNALDLRAVNVLCACLTDVAGEPADDQHRRGRKHAEDGPGVAPALAVGSLRHPSSLPTGDLCAIRALERSCTHTNRSGQRARADLLEHLGDQRRDR